MYVFVFNFCFFFLIFIGGHGGGCGRPGSGGGEKKSWMSLNGSHYIVCGTKTKGFSGAQVFVTAMGCIQIKASISKADRVILHSVALNVIVT